MEALDWSHKVSAIGLWLLARAEEGQKVLTSVAAGARAGRPVARARCLIDLKERRRASLGEKPFGKCRNGWFTLSLFLDTPLAALAALAAL